MTWNWSYVVQSIPDHRWAEQMWILNTADQVTALLGALKAKGIKAVGWEM